MSSNKKNKNKAKNKLATPQQKTDVSEVETQGEALLEVKPENLIPEERVPEIVSETVTAVVETKVPDEDTPKKPKRNRGKKKKSDKDDGDELSQELRHEMPLCEESKNSELSVTENVQETETVRAITPEVTPAARKKKNKSKKQEPTSEKPPQEEIRIAPLKKGEAPTDLKIVTVFPVETEESKSKKKNKRKKRTDSERSDKADEVLACTAAFQKLMDISDEKKNKKDLKQEIQETDGAALELTDKKEQASISTETNIVENTQYEAKENTSHEEGGRGKKKNKKDKKPPHKGDTGDEIKSTTSLTQSDTKSPEDEVTQVKEQIQQIIIGEQSALQKEKSPKPQAKIAKPVDKNQKQKGKSSSSTENLAEKPAAILHTEEQIFVSAPVAVQEPNNETIDSLKISKQTEPNKESKSKTVDILKSNTPQNKTQVKETELNLTLPVDVKPDIQDEISAQVEEFGFIPVPEGGKNKKRKKSPKPKQCKTIESLATTESITIKTDISQNKEQSVGIISSPDISKAQADELESKQSKSIAKEPKIEVGSIKPENVSSKNTGPVIDKTEILTVGVEKSTKILETPDVDKVPEIDPVKKLEKQPSNIQSPEVTSSKKRKKSPRPKNIETEPAQHSAQTEGTMPREQKENTSPSMPALEDIEIKSVITDESEGSVCDIVPDVHYPRASSQLQDDNNNVVIQEIFISETKLNVPVTIPDTPFIQGSGDTPSVTPEILTTGIMIAEVETPKNAEPSHLHKTAATTTLEEKTDLKSKVLDVNQGMEELRKSLERSLAELNAMERSEKYAEEQFAKAQAKLEAISDLANKKQEEIKQLPSISKEKSPVPVPAHEKLPSAAQAVTKEKSPMHTQPIPKDKSKLPPTKEKSPLPTQSEIKEKSPIPSQKTERKQMAEEISISRTEGKTEQSNTGGKTTVGTVEDQKPSDAPSAGESVTPQPPRRENKGKGKKKKGKQEAETATVPLPVRTDSTAITSASTSTESKEGGKEERKKADNSDQKTESSHTQDKGKQQSAKANTDVASNEMQDDAMQIDFEPIANFEDALVSSTESNEDVNKTFEMIASEVIAADTSQNPEINIIAPSEEDEKSDKKDTKNGEKVNPVSQPKNLLGHPAIPARLNKTDYKKEKNKTPNTKLAKVRIRDGIKEPIEAAKQSQESQTENKRRFLKDKTVTESVSSVINDNEEYVYKYSFRKVFLPSACHVCKKDLKSTRVPCTICNLVFYCSAKHKDEDYSQHQGLCFAVSTIIHLKDQKHIYADVKNITGQEYRLLRMQMIVSCEKVLKRRLAPWEQEALLYPRICADVGCREWRQNLLKDCDGCGQIAYCANNPSHLPSSHQRWCKSYSLYHKLVVYQQTKGRLEPRLPTRVTADVFSIPEKLNEVLAAMYEEKIDMTDIQYAALTQIATAPLTAAYCHQLYTTKMNTFFTNGVHKKTSFTIHIVGAELQFEADALNKWEVFFLHLQPGIKELRVVLIGTELNPSKLPLDLLGKIRVCENCRQNKRRVVFDFQDKKTYYEYWSTDFITPDLVCAFNPSIHRSSVFNGSDTWPATIRCILKLRVPFVVTAHTITELQQDLQRIQETIATKDIRDKEVSTKDFVVISEPKCNAFASVRPDRNFISDDEMPLLFNNYCFAVVSGAF